MINLLIKLRGFQKVHNKRIQKQLQMRMVKIYLKKYIYISPGERQEVTDDLRLKEQYNDGMKSHKSFKK